MSPREEGGHLSASERYKPTGTSVKPKDSSACLCIVSVTFPHGSVQYNTEWMTGGEVVAHTGQKSSDRASSHANRVTAKNHTLLVSLVSKKVELLLVKGSRYKLRVEIVTYIRY